jgi:hypothetical protein
MLIAARLYRFYRSSGLPRAYALRRAVANAFNFGVKS